MRVAVMQPYFLPYIGYFQLLAAVDQFVVYDTIQYTKKGWINRNRMLRSGEVVTFSLPLKKGSDFLDICDRRIADDFDPVKLGNAFAGAYRKAPEFDRVMPLVADILSFPSMNLSTFVRNSIEACCGYLGIRTRLIASSDLEGSKTNLTGADRVLALCKALDANTYLNPIGGLDLYQPSVFAESGIALKFLKTRPEPYPQGVAGFQPFLSIIDVMMSNPVERISEMLQSGYDLVDGREAPDVPMAETR
jgi:hypothetical protein